MAAFQARAEMTNLLEGVLSCCDDLKAIRTANVAGASIQAVHCRQFQSECRCSILATESTARESDEVRLEFGSEASGDLQAS